MPEQPTHRVGHAWNPLTTEFTENTEFLARTASSGRPLHRGRGRIQILTTEMTENTEILSRCVRAGLGDELTQ